MIYTGNKALQFLSVPVYTIFKNLTTIVIAYGEVLLFGGKVTPLAFLSFCLMVLSSIVAAWADIQNAANASLSKGVSSLSSNLDVGYTWMGINIVCSAAYLLSMRKIIKKMNFSDWDSRFIPFTSWIFSTDSSSHVLQQLIDDPRPAFLLACG